MQNLTKPTLTKAEETAMQLEHQSAEWNVAQLRLATWLCVPAEARIPSTVTELAKRLGYSTETLAAWRRNPAFADMVSAWKRSLVRAGGVQDVLDAAQRKATRLGEEDVAAMRLVLDYAGELSTAEARSAALSATELTLSIDGEEITVQLRQATKS